MTWALVIGCWVAVALVLGLFIGAMIRRAEAKEQESEAWRPVLVVTPRSPEPPAGAGEGQGAPDPPGRRTHPME